MREVQKLLERKQGTNYSAFNGQMISEDELREVENEADRQLKKLVCPVTDCARGFKTQNGLRYHFKDHSGIGRHRRRTTTRTGSRTGVDG